MYSSSCVHSYTYEFYFPIHVCGGTMSPHTVAEIGREVQRN